jgi:hypothetical protein
MHLFPQVFSRFSSQYEDQVLLLQHSAAPVFVIRVTVQQGIEPHAASKQVLAQSTLTRVEITVGLNSRPRKEQFSIRILEARAKHMAEHGKYTN